MDRRRLGALLVGLVIALSLPAASVLADTLPTEDGVWLEAATPACSTSCREYAVRVDKDASTPGAVCLEVWDHDATDAVAYSNGCTFGISSITYTNGYITGLTDTVVILTDESGTQRAVTLSLAMPVSGAITRSVDSTTYLDGTCTVFWTGRSRTAPVSGSITVSGGALAATGTSVQLFVKTRTRC